MTIRWSMPLLLALAGCGGPSLYAPLPQSGFALPNADFLPLNHVKATVSHTYFMPFEMPTGGGNGTMQREAYLQAMKGSDGDLIIDGDYTTKTTLYPLAVVTLMVVQGTVEGTAAKVKTVGSRNLIGTPASP
jgi:hypothetical protein